MSDLVKRLRNVQLYALTNASVLPDEAAAAIERKDAALREAREWIEYDTMMSNAGEQAKQDMLAIIDAALKD